MRNELLEIKIKQITIPGRIEYKYYVPLVARPYLLNDLKKFTEIDSYASEANGGYEVASIYFENLGLTCYHDKLEGQPKRVKLRLRFYPPFNQNDMVSVEFKHKVYDKCFKEKTKIGYELFKHLCNADSRELDYEVSDPVLLHFMDAKRANSLYPFIRIDYSRMPFFACNDRHVRITLDNNVRCCRVIGDIGSEPNIPVLAPDISVLEIKSPDYFPFWLSYIIKKYSLRRTAISKYSLSVQNLAVNSSLSVR